MQDMRDGNCPLCQHHEIIAAPVVDFHHFNTSDPAYVVSKPSFWMGKGGGSNHGALTLFVCRACGFAQQFAQAPETIPIDESLGIRLIQGQPKPPYR